MSSINSEHSVARVKISMDDPRVPRPRPGSTTGEFRSQLAAIREPKPDDDEPRVRDRNNRDEQAPKRRRYEDDDDVVVWEQPAQPRRPMENLDEVGEMQLAATRLARGSGQIAVPAMGKTMIDEAQLAAPVKRPSTEPSIAALTPLEQAVHDLIAKVKDVMAESESDELPVQMPEATPIAAVDAKGPPPVMIPKQHAPIAPVRDVALAADAATSTPTSHVHLVIDDGAGRMVVTVAVRGSDVNVSLRGGDDATTASLARNAGSLDHAMRARGLDLSEFTAEPDRRSAKQEQPEPERRDPRAPKFSLEEHA